MKRLGLICVALLLVAGCERKAQTVQPAAPVPATPRPSPTYPPVEPKPPGSPGALPDDRTPISEAPFTPTSAQGAADVVQTYFALIGEGKYPDAWRLWSNGGQAGAPTSEAFAAKFAGYDNYHGLVGAPGRIEGAAGSLYVEVPIQTYGRAKDGREVHQLGVATLRRSNDVPGSTAEQGLWRISKITLTAAG